MKPHRRKTKRYFYDETLTIRIKDARGRIVRELPVNTARKYDIALLHLRKMNHRINKRSRHTA
jgi:hypothetical protein